MRIEVKGNWKFPELDMPKLLNDIGNYAVSSVVKRIKTGVPPQDSPLTVESKRGNNTLQDTGRLMQSINYQVRGDSVVIGTNRKFADVMQHGATITPKSAQKLAIPVGWRIRRSVQANGIRGTIDELKSQGWHIFFTDKAIMGSKGKGKRKTTKVFFVRKGSVEIPPRPFLYADEDDKAEMKQIIEEAIHDS